MFLNEYPVFVRKNLLKIDMLENLRDFPRDLVDIYYHTFGDGILYGCEIEVDDLHLILNPGILLYNRTCYLLKRAEKIPYAAKEHIMYLKIKFLDKHQDLEKVSSLTQLYLDMEAPNQKDEIEMARFCLQEGSKLRDRYINLEDFDTSYDTLNRIHVPYAVKGGETLWPFILQYFAREAMKHGGDTIDLIFCMNIQRDATPVSREMILSYLDSRGGRVSHQMGNYELYKELVRTLADIRQGRNPVGNNRGGHSKILLD